MLREAVTVWANKKMLKSWMFFESFDLPSINEVESNKSFIFFGDFLASYIYFIENQIRNKDIYVLCHKSKLIIESLESKTTNNIIVIDRYDLFEKTKEEKDLPRLKKDSFDLIYSGRISRSKNIMNILFLVKKLQEYNPNIGLKIIGEFDPFLNITSEVSPYQFSIEKEVEDFIESGQWSKKPIIIRGHSSTSWLKEIKANDIMINLSSYWMEDFSVSIAQAQQLGIPVIVSDVGGLSDVEGKNVIKIPYHLIGQSFFVQDEEVYWAQAACLTSFLLNPPKVVNSLSVKLQTIKAPSFNSIVALKAFDFFRTQAGREALLGYEKIWKASTEYGEKKKILFLQTQEQNHWSSLVKISDQIQKFWIEFQSAEFELVVIKVDSQLSKAALLNGLGQVELIVAQALAENTINTLKLLREVLKIDVPVIAYPHELATVFYSSLKLRKLNDFFQEKDIFVVHCDADIALTKKSFKKVNVVKIPAGFINQIKEKQVTTFLPQDLYYIGRVSEQKNLHTLLWSIYLIKETLLETKTKLHIYGHHDHFGSPNFGISGGAYLDLLGDMIERLKLSDIVVFHGHKAVPDWAKHIAEKKGIGIFPSLHVDENFGYAPFDLLKEGVPVVLSRWGGYRDLIKYFPELAHGVNVYQSDIGPVISPNDLSKSILTQLNKTTNLNKKETFLYWSKEAWLEQLKDFLHKASKSRKPLEQSDLGKKITANCLFSPHVSLKARGWLLNGIIFKDYKDPNFLIASKLYGAKKLPEVESKALILAPWVEKREKDFLIKDPMKGTYKVTQKKKLVKLGLAFKALISKS